jgi:high-affinity nickel-transport protein
MGLIRDNCATCSAAAKNSHGLAGGWWRFWAKVRDLHVVVLTEHALTQVPQRRQANDNSGYIGAGIVGSFVMVVGGWYGGRWVFSKWKRVRARP